MRLDFLLVALTLAFTAVPIQLQLLDPRALFDAFRSQLDVSDFVANILGYIPVGIVLARRHAMRALALAFTVSFFAEVVQLFCVGRDPSVLDITANLLGAGFGLVLASRWRMLPERVHVSPAVAGVAAAAASVYAVFGTDLTIEGIEHGISTSVVAPPWMATNARGRLSPGRLEADWPFDSFDNNTLADTSGNRLSGVRINEPTLSPGVVDSAIALNGKQWVDFGRPSSLRLTGSMTLSAWVNPHAFPDDDAAIISSLSASELGYQLDLTVDEGPRTVGFKIADSSGRLLARYGRTPIVTDRWYHVAGVYDAASRTLEVYLNGQRDSGCLMGTVTASQHASGSHAFVGRRAGLAGFPFTGSVDEARIYSRPLSQSEIQVAFDADSRRLPRPLQLRAANESGKTGDAACRSRPARQARVAGPLVAFGMLVALACLGLWSGVRFVVVSLVLCLAAGFAVSIWTRTGLALEPGWLPMLYALAGGGVVVAANWQRRPSS